MIPGRKDRLRKEGGSIGSYWLLLLVLAGGAYFDVKEHRIPNWWSITAVMTGVLFCALEEGVFHTAGVIWLAAGSFLLRMTAVCAMFFPLFILRMIGAGDIKLAALICGYLGMKSGMTAVFTGFIAGAVWSFVKMIADGTFTERILYLTAYIRRVYHTKVITAYYDPVRDGYDAVIPLGLCFLAGCVLVMLS